MRLLSLLFYIVLSCSHVGGYGGTLRLLLNQLKDRVRSGEGIALELAHRTGLAPFQQCRDVVDHQHGVSSVRVLKTMQSVPSKVAAMGMSTKENNNNNKEKRSSDASQAVTVAIHCKIAASY